jgi:4,4'-diaponeurosporenoate glycosyltransferase
MPENAALSVLPFHRTQCWYEELSLFFNIVLAMGAGGFGGIDAPHLFGQSMLVRREIYWKAGGHESVKGEILENLNFAMRVRAAGGTSIALGGRGTLEMRMFPHGVEQVRESWQKAFAAGAGVASPVVLGLSIYWLAAAMLAALLLLAVRSSFWPGFAALYLMNAIQIGWYGRQLGTFRRLTALLYPVALLFYFAVFAQSVLLRMRGGRAIWRGREV